mmetsp:Transcript_17822/g.45204  ORF Transcript_17822/g.45204 Transcript_17822/m.45204 type:complete len:141 (+) Transcript_17822:272-694(+)
MGVFDFSQSTPIPVLRSLNGFSRTTWAFSHEFPAASPGPVDEDNASLDGVLIVVIMAASTSAMHIIVSQTLPQRGSVRLRVVDRITENDDLFRVDDNDDDGTVLTVLAPFPSSSDTFTRSGRSPTSLVPAFPLPRAPSST